MRTPKYIYALVALGLLTLLSTHSVQAQEETTTVVNGEVPTTVVNGEVPSPVVNEEVPSPAESADVAKPDQDSTAMEAIPLADTPAEHDSPATPQTTIAPEPVAPPATEATVEPTPTTTTHPEDDPTRTPPATTTLLVEPPPTVAPTMVAAPPTTATPTLLAEQNLATPVPTPDNTTGGLWRVLQLTLLATLLYCLMLLGERLGQKLAQTGVIPRFLRGFLALTRVTMFGVLGLALLAMVPQDWRDAQPYALVAVAIAIGWTTRDLLSDLFAGIVLVIEKKPTKGSRVEILGMSGTVANVGWRTTHLLLDDGRVMQIPNRQVTKGIIKQDPDKYPPAKVPIHVPMALHVSHVRQTLEELVLLSPYLAPMRPPLIYRDPEREDVWILEARLIHARYANAFRGAMVELADQQFRSRSLDNAQ